MLGLGLGLGLSITTLASGVAWTALSAPAGLLYTPSFGVEIGSNGAYRHNFSMAAVKPVPTHTIYCGPGGDNAANGLTWATRVRSLNRAIASSCTGLTTA